MICSGQNKNPPPLHKMNCAVRADFRGATLRASASGDLFHRLIATSVITVTEDSGLPLSQQPPASIACNLGPIPNSFGTKVQVLTAGTLPRQIKKSSKRKTPTPQGCRGLRGLLFVVLEKVLKLSSFSKLL